MLKSFTHTNTRSSHRLVLKKHVSGYTYDSWVQKIKMSRINLGLKLFENNVNNCLLVSLKFSQN